MAPKRTYRYYVRTKDGRAIYGFDRLEAATEVAFQYGAGAQLVDTMAQAYFPIVQEVAVTDGDKELVYLPFGGWDTGRFGPDRDMIEGIKKGHVAIVHAYLAKGADANARDAKGGPALIWAVARRKPDIVELLIAHGADVNAADHDGTTALALALTRNDEAMADILRKAGAREPD